MPIRNKTNYRKTKASKEPMKNQELGSFKAYLGPVGAFALSFGCAIGWGAFLVPGTSFLPGSGLLGSLIGLGIGLVIMLVIARNYHTMIVQHPKAGGVFTVTRHMLNFDHGLLCAWFLCLTYLGLIWANCSAVALLVRYTLGDILPCHFLYSVAGFDIYLEEVLLCLIALVVAGGITLSSKKGAAWAQILFVLVLLAGIIISFLCALKAHPSERPIGPLFLPGSSPFLQVIRAVSIMPWAFVGFESISHAAEEFTFSPKLSFRIMSLSILMAVIAYVLMLFTSVLMLPPQYPNWVAYIRDLGSLKGIASVPTFSAVWQTLGKAGIVLLGLTMLGGLFSSLVGNILCLSRLLTIMAEKGILPLWLGKRTSEGIPQNAIIVIVCTSFFIPFLGRTAIGWNVDVSNIGATIAYIYTSLDAYRYSKVTKDKKTRFFGLLGIIFSSIFLILQLIPRYALSKESFLILSVWVILGFLLSYHVFKRDRSGSYGRSTIVWVVLVGLSIYATVSFVWQASQTGYQVTAQNIEEYYGEKEKGQETEGVKASEVSDLQKAGEDEIDHYPLPSKPGQQAETDFPEGSANIPREQKPDSFVKTQLRHYHLSQMGNYFLSLVLILIALRVLLSSYSVMNQRELENEQMLGEVKNTAFRDKLTGAQSINAYRDKEMEINSLIKNGRTDPFALVICDINDLKKINDQLGHQAGDDHLRAAVQLLQSIFIGTPLYRIGGDEFILLLVGYDYENRHKLLEDLDAANQEHLQNGKVTVAAGLGEWTGRGELIASVFARADICMYQKKSEMKSLRGESPRDQAPQSI